MHRAPTRYARREPRRPFPLGLDGFFAHHGAWAPGVRLFRRLSFRSKAILISATFLVPLATLSTVYLRHSAAALHAKAQAQVGIAYAAEVLPLVTLLQQQRHAGVQAGAGAAEAPPAAAAPAAPIGTQLGRIAALQQAHGAWLGERTDEALQVLRANIDKAGARQGASHPLAQHKRQSQAIDAAFGLLDAVLDGSGLTLDADADTNQLIHTGLAQLPRLAEAALAVNDLGLAAAHGADAATAARMAAPLRAIGLYLDGQIRQGLDKVVAMHPGLAQRIAYAATQEAMARMDERVAGLGEADGAADAPALLAARQALATPAAALQAQLLTTLGALEQQRVERMRLERNLLLGLLAVTLLLAAYMFVAFARVMQGGLDEVRRHLRAMADGDLTTSPNPWGRDEAARLMLDLRTMQDALRDIVLQVRASSEDIVSSSQQIATGANELSIRADQTAASLQRSAASLEEIGTTVRQTADDAGQATGIGRDSAAAAQRGGQVIERVHATMHDIRDSSGRIGEIVGVIDGIAFQTNLLALNAAVEAARAGEAGRGFAVVAAEVRTLAQRCAGAAREIKAIVGASIDKVNGGVGVVGDASAAMGDIVESVRRVDALLRGIATGTQEQARGVTEIGVAVNEVDTVTQRNAALSQQTAAAAAALEDRAQVLAERVARFVLPEPAAATDAG